MTTQQKAQLDAIEGDVLDSLRARLRHGSRRRNDERIAAMNADRMLEEYFAWYGMDAGWAYRVRDAIRAINAAQSIDTSAEVPRKGDA